MISHNTGNVEKKYLLDFHRETLSESVNLHRHNKN